MKTPLLPPPPTWQESLLNGGGRLVQTARKEDKWRSDLAQTRLKHSILNQRLLPYWYCTGSVDEKEGSLGLCHQPATPVLVLLLTQSCALPDSQTTVQQSTLCKLVINDRRQRRVTHEYTDTHEQTINWSDTASPWSPFSKTTKLSPIISDHWLSQIELWSPGHGSTFVDLVSWCNIQ